DVRPMPQDVHHELLMLAIRDAQLERSVLKTGGFLLRMPLLIRHPPRAFRREAQYGDLVRLAAEDAVGAGVMRIELGFGHIERRLIEDHGPDDAIDGEAAQRVTALVPGVEIPAFAIVRDALGRDGALGAFVAAAGVVLHPELLPL